MTTDKPDCDICGQPYRQHNINTGVAFCPIFAIYRPKSSTLSQQADLIQKLREGLENARAEIALLKALSQQANPLPSHLQKPQAEDK